MREMGKKKEHNCQQEMAFLAPCHLDDPLRFQTQGLGQLQYELGISIDEDTLERPRHSCPSGCEFPLTDCASLTGPKIVDKIIDSIAINLYGYADIQAAVALSLFGAVSKVVSDRRSNCSDVDVLPLARK
ncbi:hypothetical protein HBI70_229080 [Parastagonospora nodorum]|nr:hypothetical protein HBH50_199980 [Parastagonospora nodorum]KAH4081445.1 hypothetical protein HBH48_195630 [Parastagonospora nodorum]KAH4084885.1 hypothetical protein HBH46_211330 [Parastagonospora nodorum]KAH4799900.1 hypothetical protein HBH61_221330 [Parastagonospora nodorum]KAH5245837.1 hypothetical protein HBI70_229080 [Parastagonospora nodorum]